MMQRVKKTAKSILPSFAAKALKILVEKTHRNITDWRNRRKTNEEVFTSVYINNKWGGQKGDFCSGSGSTDPEIVNAYIAAVKDFVIKENLTNGTFVDLGCGDFRVGIDISKLCNMYIGVDVVKPLVDRNNNTYGSSSIRFHKIDIVHDDLPDGDMCLIRQVLQHLSNSEISTILNKLEKYRYVIITEHYPDDASSPIPNIDKVHGDDIRAARNSGVYLSEPPFLIPQNRLRCILEAPLNNIGNFNSGTLKTFVFLPCGECLIPTTA